MTKWMTRPALAALLALWGGMALAADSAVIFTYHRFEDSRFPNANTRLDQLDAHIAELKAGGYKVLPVPTIVDALANGKALPEKAVGLTVDDAWYTVWEQAWPRLKAAGLPFTIFVVTDETDRGGADYLTWDRLREMEASNLVTIGSQGASHAHLVAMSPASVAEDLARSNERFEAELGHRPDLFAWPYGEMSLEAADVVRQSGFKAAFGQHSGPVWRGAEPWFLPRFPLNETYGEPERFRLAARSLPLKVADITPADPRLIANPPAFGFTVVGDPAGLEHLACYASHVGRAQTERLGERIEVRVQLPFPPGRGRMNCTAPALDGRWRWFGWQFYVP
jgi:peptidoglycan/xylan/chitin deacetylase (PgdA/CDA1 family)